MPNKTVKQHISTSSLVTTLDQQNKFQNILHEIAAGFFTGARLSTLNKIVYPHNLFYNASLCQIDIIEQLIPALLKSKAKNLLLKHILSLKNKKTYSAKEIAKLLSLGWQILEQNKGKGKAIHFQFNPLDTSYYSADDPEILTVLKKLNEIGSGLHSQTIGSLILFGSFATRDYVTGHSDLDLAFVISKKAYSNPETLFRLRKVFAALMRESYFVDPLQHHGPYIFSESDLLAFPQSYLPFEVLRNTVSCSCKIKLTFYERACFSEVRTQLNEYQRLFEALIKNPKTMFLNVYRTKYVLQSLLLFPSIYLCAIGNACYKRDSFARIKQYLRPEGTALLNALEGVRAQNSFKTNPAKPWMQHIFRKVWQPFVYPWLIRKTITPLNQKTQVRITKLLASGVQDFLRLAQEASK